MAQLDHIEVDGVKFYNDRFYLNEPTNTKKATQCSSTEENSVLPLFNRSKLISSLDLSAAIVGTYTFDPLWLHHELPMLFPQPSKATTAKLQGDFIAAPEIKSVPTLLLHGLHESSLMKMRHKIKKSNQSYQEIDTLPSLFNKSVNVSRVQPTWIPPSSSSENKGNAKKASSHENQKRFQGVHHPKYFLLFEKRGSIVIIISTHNLTKPTSTDATWIQRFDSHHFQTVNVPTSSQPSNNDSYLNCHGQDFGWVLMDFLQKTQAAIAPCHLDTALDTLGSHFPLDFMRQHVHGINSWTDFAHNYRFQDSSIFLVSTVPGCYPGSFRSFRGQQKSNISEPQSEKYQNTFKCLYGPQRVSHVLSCLKSPMPLPSKNHIDPTPSAAINSFPNKRRRFGHRGIDNWNRNRHLHDSQNNREGGDKKPWIPSNGFMTKKDRLIMQTTSLGGNWSYTDMNELVKYYLGENDKGLNTHTDVLDQSDIIWPSSDFIQSCGDTKSSADENQMEEEIRPNCYAFLSSTTFNTISIDCLCRLALYEHNYPSHFLSPHIKSFGRILSSDHLKSFSDIDSTLLRNEKDFFAWFMITSACLSKGAQGQPSPDRTLESDFITYSNFELGALFCSRLQGNGDMDRIYTWNPKLESKKTQVDLNTFLKKKDTEGNSPVEVIHLPIPYNVRPRPYMEDPEDTEMSFTPFFHEIDPGTECSGHMRLTPFGKKRETERR